MKNCLLLPILFFAINSFAQSNIMWQKTIGCAGIELSNDIAVDGVGNYFLAGYYTDECAFTDTLFGFFDGWVIKLGSAGNKIWSKGIGGSDLETFVKVLPVSDGGVVALGYEASDFGSITNKGEWDFFIVKLDSVGNVLWQKNFGGSDYDVPADIIETSNGDYIAVGYTISKDGDITDTIGGLTDGWALRINSQGNMIWNNSYGSTDNDYLTKIIKANNGDYLILGESGGTDYDLSSSTNHGYLDIWVLTIDDAGVIQWGKTYGGTGNDLAKSITKCNQSGGYVFAASTESTDFDFSQNHGGSDAWLCKIDSIGNIEWKKNYGGTNNEGSSYVVASKEGGYMLLSSTTSNDIDAVGNHGGADLMAVKVDDTGKIIWTRMYGSTGPDIGYGIVQLADSSYLAVAYTKSATGDVLATYGATDVWLFRLWKDSTFVPTALNDPEISLKEIQVYPTIAHNEVTIKKSIANKEGFVVLTNVEGQALLERRTFSGEETTKIDITPLPPGVYFLKVIVGSQAFTYKIIHN